MNGIEKITARINADADKEIAAIQKETEKQVAEIEESFKAQAEKESAQILERGKKTAAEREVRLDNMAQMESKKMILAAKQEMLDEAFVRALNRLNNLPEAEMISLLGGLAAKASASGKEEVILNAAQQKTIGAKAVAEANRLLAAEGKKAALTLSEKTADISGGILLNDEDTEVNCAFETLVRLARGEIAGQVATLLFA